MEAEAERLRRIGAELADLPSGKRQARGRRSNTKYSRGWAHGHRHGTRAGRRSGDSQGQAISASDMGHPTRSSFFRGAQAEAEAQYRDSFALGCLVYYVMTGGDHPYGRTAQDRVRGIRCRSKPDLSGLSDRREFAARDLVSRLLHHDHRRR